MFTSQLRHQNVLQQIAAVAFLYPYIFFIRIGIQVPFFVFLLLPLVFASLPAYRDQRLDKDLIAIGASYLGLLVLSALYFLKPLNDAWYFTMFWGLRISFLVYAILFVLCFKKFFKWSTENFITAIIITFLVHGVIAWIGFFSANIRDYFFEIQHMSSVAREALAISAFNYRLPTFGMMFFGSGVLYASCLVLIFKKIEASPKSLLRWILFFAVFLTGMSISRTTIIAVPVIITLALLSTYRRQVFFFGSISAVIFSIFLLCLESFERTKPVTHWIAEPILSFAQNGKFTTGSTEETFQTAQKVLDSISDQPKKLSPSTSTSEKPKAQVQLSPTTSTLVTGSGRLFSEDGKAYFGGTDVGYLRLILFGGVSYLLLFFIPSFLTTLYGFSDPRIRPYCAALAGIFIIQLVANLKGLVELSGFLILIFVIFTVDVKHESQTVR